MKKTNLITTLALVVIVAIALSTATYAWYTSQSSAKASTTLYAAQSTSASIAIDKTADVTSTNTSLTFTLDKNVAPMVPKTETAPVVGETTYSTMTTNYFIGAPINAAGYFTAAGTSDDAAKIKSVKTEADTEQSSFYVINTNSNSAATVSVKVTGNADGYTLLTQKPADWATLNAAETQTTSDKYFSKTETGAYTGLSMGKTNLVNWAANTYYVKNSVILAQLRVAVFQGADGKLVGIWAGTDTKTTNYYAGTEAWKTAADADTKTAVSQMTQFNALASGAECAEAQRLTIAAQTGTEIKVIAWFDGQGLVDALSGLGTAFTIEFNVVNA